MNEFYMLKMHVTGSGGFLKAPQEGMYTTEYDKAERFNTLEEALKSLEALCLKYKYNNFVIIKASEDFSKWSSHR